MHNTRIMQVAAVVSSKPRLAFIDNVRWVMIVFVVAMHAAVTYSTIGSWYYIEPPPPGGITIFLFATFQAWLQAFFMGFLFLIAGYFVPASLDRKGPRKFMADRAVRLGIPSLLYVFAVHPFLVYAILGPTWKRPAPPFPQAFVSYLTSLRFLSGTGPMWFAVALLFFTGVCTLIRLTKSPSPIYQTDGKLPGNREVVLLALAIAACSFLVRIVQPIGTAVYNMQLCFFSQYVLLFAVGIQAYRKNWLARIPYDFGMRWLKIALIGGGGAWIAGMGFGGGAANLTAYVGGPTWRSAVACLWEAFFCVGVCLGLLVLFRERFSAQGKLAKAFSDNAFAVYVFHPPILVAISLAMRGFHAPPLAKFAVACTLALAATFLASHLVFRRLPPLGRIL